MKKVLLSFALVVAGFGTHAQVSCRGVSPISIAGDYVFEWADPAGGDWATPDFLVPGTFVQDTLAIVNDGTPGTNSQGNPIAAEGCSPLINGVDVTGKIAVIYRNTCEFGAKALNAQNAGAVGVIIINRDDEAIPMGGGADGGSVTIPVVMLSSSDGLLLTNEMLNGPVVMFLGNKIGLNANDVGNQPQFTLISPYGTASSTLFEGFDLGVQFVNYGSNDQSNVTVNATIDGPSGNVYDETIGPLTMLAMAQDTVSAYVGNTVAFPSFDLGGIGNYPVGEYTLTYTFDLGITDEDPVDNTYTSSFSITDDMISRGNWAAGNVPADLTFPSNTDGEYQSCIMFQEPNASQLGVEGVYFVPFSTDSAEALVGEEILINVIEWNDTWADLNDAAWTTANGAFQDLATPVTISYTVTSASEQGASVYVPLPSFQLVDNQRYLFCVQTFTPTVAFGYDDAIDYDGITNVGLQPVGAIFTVDNAAATPARWFSGWSGANASAVGMAIIPASEVGINEAGALDAVVYPNPTTEDVTIKLSSKENGTLVVTDLAGKVVSNTVLSFATGATNFNTSSFETGMYIFNITLDNGQTTQFTVVKR